MTGISSASKETIALAAGAHPDDIEFMMAGTLLRCKEAGAQIHMWNLSSGHCGTNECDGDAIARIRWAEAQASARAAGAEISPPITEDIAIYYEPSLIARAAAVIRTVKPNIILLPSPQDYMEDHMIACRILVTAAFVRGLKNYEPSPAVDPWMGPTALYHAMPHGLRDPLRKRVRPGQYVDITPVLETKKTMLSLHGSQKDWLDYSQGIGAYLALMESFSAEVGQMSGRFDFAEGWRRHLHWGYGADDYDPLGELLGSTCWTDPEYEEDLERWG